MANITETAAFEAAVYLIETTDPVQGGALGVSNAQAKALANRTLYLKQQQDGLLASVAALSTAVSAPETTQAAGDDDTSRATTAFVHRSQGGSAVVDAAGTGNLVLTSDQWGCAVIILTGTLTGARNIIFPTRSDRWLVVNRTTGNHALTCKTAAGAGVRVAQLRSKSIFGDGTDILDEETDLSTRPVRVTSATTMAPGGQYTVDFSGGVFAMTLPANPSDQDQCVVRGNFFDANLTVLRNGQLIMDNDGDAQAMNYLANRNNVSLVFTYVTPAVGSAAWLVTQG